MKRDDLTALADDLAEYAKDWRTRAGDVQPVLKAVTALRTVASQQAEPVTWRCFHCDEVFTDPNVACDHFGPDCSATPACQIAARDSGLVRLIREQEEELCRYRQEDTESYRQFYALGADHRQALIREEQKGYDRGLADGGADTAPPATDAVQEVLKSGDHYLGTIRVRLEHLYKDHSDDRRLCEQISDEIDWIDDLHDALAQRRGTSSDGPAQLSALKGESADEQERPRGPSEPPAAERIEQGGRIIGTAGEYAIDDRASFIPTSYLTDRERKSLEDFQFLKSAPSPSEALPIVGDEGGGP